MITIEIDNTIRPVAARELAMLVARVTQAPVNLVKAGIRIDVYPRDSWMTIEARFASASGHKATL